MTDSQTKQPLHTFVVPAYQESPHLDACLWSLRQQSVKSRVLIVTSTPNAHIRQVAAKHDVPVLVNPNGGSIVSDWNYALEQGGSGLLTLAHQDDIYTERYAEACLSSAVKHPELLAVFTDYAEIVGDGGQVRGNTAMLQIKRLLLLPYRLKPALYSRILKKSVLLLGSPICCPSVCLNMDRLGGFRFNAEYTVNMDWDAWLHLAMLSGPMVYVRERYCLHRIHSGSETSVGLRENRRAEEDLRIFRRLWPKPLAHVIARAYSMSYQSNAVAETANVNSERTRSEEIRKVDRA